VIQKKRRDYLDPNSTSNMKKLNDDLQSIHNIMRKTIDDVLDRGNKLDGLVICPSFSPACFFHESLSLCLSFPALSPEDVSDISKSLAEDSKKYKWGAKKLSVMVTHPSSSPSSS
jgi:vesicle transport protein SEC22